MANVAMTVAMLPTHIPFERPTDPATLWSVIPRGLRGFQKFSAVTAKPLNDTETVNLTGTLPANFAYIFAGITFRLSQDVANDWNKSYSLKLDNWYQGIAGLSTNWLFPFDELGLNGAVIASGSASYDHVPKSPMWAARETSGISVSIGALNEGAAEGAAGTMVITCQFWEFDLEQVRKYPINSPIPTHSR